MVEDRPGGDRVEAIQEGAELGGRHPLCQGRGPADVGEEESQLDLRATVMTGQEREARLAHVRVLVRLPLADETHDRRADPAEWRGAHVAARPPRDPYQESPGGDLHRAPLRQIVVPVLVVLHVGRLAGCHGSRVPPEPCG